MFLCTSIHPLLLVADQSRKVLGWTTSKVEVPFNIALNRKRLALKELHEDLAVEAERKGTVVMDRVHITERRH